MSVRAALIAILAQGPCYGNQLRHEFDRRTGGAWPLNVGQVYRTLDRLERDGLAEQRGPNHEGYPVYALTAAGQTEAERWLSTAVGRAGAERSEIAIKLAIAVTLPGADPMAIIATQRAATAEMKAQLEPELVPGSGDGDLASEIIAASTRLAIEAELHWLDECERLITTTTQPPFALSEAPKRGRPARVSE